MEKEGKEDRVCESEKEGEQVGRMKREGWRERESDDEGHRRMGEDKRNVRSFAIKWHLITGS